MSVKRDSRIILAAASFLLKYHIYIVTGNWVKLDCNFTYDLIVLIMAIPQPRTTLVFILEQGPNMDHYGIFTGENLVCLENALAALSPETLLRRSVGFITSALSRGNIPD